MYTSSVSVQVAINLSTVDVDQLPSFVHILFNDCNLDFTFIAVFFIS